MPALTGDDVARLLGLLEAGDRGGFYYTYAQMIRDVSPTSFDQVMMQAQISTYGGLWGGAAIVANGVAQNQAGIDAFGNPFRMAGMNQLKSKRCMGPSSVDRLVTRISSPDQRSAKS